MAQDRSNINYFTEAENASSLEMAGVATDSVAPVTTNIEVPSQENNY